MDIPFVISNSQRRTWPYALPLHSRVVMQTITDDLTNELPDNRTMAIGSSVT